MADAITSTGATAAAAASTGKTPRASPRTSIPS